MKDYKKVSCNGFDEKSPHPKIYLLTNTNKDIICPYCSKNFKSK